MMALDFLTAPPSARVADVLTMVCEARSMQAEALTSVHCVEEDDRLIGTATVVALLQVGRDSLLREVMVTEPVRVLPDTDIEDVALLMTDYNLLTVPVVDERDRVLGVITVDDILEAVIPEDWRRREPGPHPIRRGEQPGTGEPTHAQDSGG
jgi:Mg/Co/Ni transporter MgtE